MERKPKKFHEETNQAINKYKSYFTTKIEDFKVRKWEYDKRKQNQETEGAYRNETGQRRTT